MGSWPGGAVGGVMIMVVEKRRAKRKIFQAASGRQLTLAGPFVRRGGSDDPPSFAQNGPQFVALGDEEGLLRAHPVEAIVRPARPGRRWACCGRSSPGSPCPTRSACRPTR